MRMATRNAALSAGKALRLRIVAWFVDGVRRGDEFTGILPLRHSKMRNPVVPP